MSTGLQPNDIYARTPAKELCLGPAFHMLVHAYFFSLSPEGSLPGHFAHKSRDIDLVISPHHQLKVGRML